MKAMKSMIGVMMGCAVIATVTACQATDNSAPVSTESTQTDTNKEIAVAGSQNQEKGTKWPEKPIEIIVSASAGGDCDYNARTLAEALTRKLGVSVVVSNVTGSGSVLGNRQAKDSAPDGYTLLLTHEGIQINRAAGLSDFDIHDYELVGTVGKGSGYCLATGTTKGFETFQDMIDYSKEHPGELTLSTGTGSTTEIMGFMVKEMGADLTDVDFGDAAQKLAGLVGGQLDATFLTWSAMEQYVENGEMVSLGLLADERCPYFENVATMKEQGFDISMQPHYLLAFPKDTDQEIVSKMRNAVVDIIENDETYLNALKNYKQEPYFEDAETSYEFYDKIYEDSLEYYNKMGVN